MGLRDLVKAISPPWLSKDVAEKFLYDPALALDALIDKLGQAMVAHVPTYGDPSALPFLSSDRIILQGINETNASFALRLKLAYDDWRIAGNARSILRQTLAFFTPMTPLARHVSNTSVWDSYAVGSNTTTLAPVHYKAAIANWNWDGLATAWWRAWVIYYAIAPNAFAAKGVKWGATGAKWGDKTRSWGMSIPSTQVASLRAILKQWKSAESTVAWMIVSFDATLFDPAQPTGGGINPDGTWGTWAKNVGGVSVASRPANARYCDGV